MRNKRLKSSRRRRPNRNPVSVRKNRAANQRILEHLAVLILNAARRGYNIFQLEPVTSKDPRGYRTDLVLMCSRPPDKRFIPESAVVQAVPEIFMPGKKGRPQ